MEGHPMLKDQQTQYCENVYTIKSNLYAQCNISQNSNDIVPQDIKVSPKINMEAQKTSNRQTILSKKEQHWRYHKNRLQTTL
jgi:fumarate hydratase class II